MGFTTKVPHCKVGFFVKLLKRSWETPGNHKKDFRKLLMICENFEKSFINLLLCYIYIYIFTGSVRIRINYSLCMILDVLACIRLSAVRARMYR